MHRNIYSYLECLLSSGRLQSLKLVLPLRLSVLTSSVFASWEVARPSLDRAAISLLLLPSVLTLVHKSDGLTFSPLLFVIVIVLLLLVLFFYILLLPPSLVCCPSSLSSSWRRWPLIPGRQTAGATAMYWNRATKFAQHFRQLLRNGPWQKGPTCS